MNSSEVTVCMKCLHFLNIAPIAPGTPQEHIWYSHLCKATPLPVKIDPYDGREKPYGVNDLGGEYFTENQFHYCRNVNSGACPTFQMK